MTFGYNATAAFGQSTSGVIDHAKSLLSSLIDKRDEPEEIDRPLIFVAHNLGGIVVKQSDRRAPGAAGATVSVYQQCHAGHSLLRHTTPWEREGSL